MSVFVTDGDQRATLAVVRSLGRAGIPVAVGHHDEQSLAGASRYCVHRVRYPAPECDPTGFQRFLRTEMRAGGYRVLLPMTDVTTQLVAELRDELAGKVRIPIPPAAVVEAARDKRHVLALAANLGILAPETWEPVAGESLEDFAARIRYPAVVKTRFSRQRRGENWVHGGVTYAATPSELVAKYRAMDAVIPAPIVQETIAGDGIGVFLLLWRGELKAAFCHRRLREKPPWGGVSVLRESLPLDAELVRQSEQLLRALDWEGAAMVEYKRDRRDGRAKLMEVNGRFWGSLQLAVDAGLDFPLLVYRLALGEDVAPAMAYRAGVKSRWLLGDLDHLLTVLRAKSVANGRPRMEASRLGAVARFFNFFDPKTHGEVQRWSDRAPGWYECRRWLTETFGSRSRKATKAEASRAR
jgi:predicted ATP-grasp superfamily ATP-dependent carboligase